jgi:tellurite resistance-related uncharacterized protein
MARELAGTGFDYSTLDPIVSPQEQIIGLLLDGLQKLADAGETDAACHIAGRACVILGRASPRDERRFNALLLRIGRRLGNERVAKRMNEQSESGKALPPELPADVVSYSRTPDFTPETLPKAFKSAHTTKSGVWGLIHVLDGRLSYHLEPPHEGSKLVSAGETALIPPNIPHRVAFVEGGRFFVEFFKKPNP